MKEMKNKIGPITGTFIDEITYDIPSSNWSFDQWRADLDNMQAIGIDTLIFIRGGFEKKSVFPSKFVGTPHADDLAGFIFKEASERNMKVFMGLYISNLLWNHGDAAGEIQKNRIFVDEVLERYGDYPSFYGWYVPQEVCREELNICELTKGLSALCKDKTPDKKILLSPFFYGEFTEEQHYEEWHRIFSKCGKDVDICAFQDGSAPAEKMGGFFKATRKVCDEFDIHHWVNAETFERDVRRMYYPIPFSMLKQRLENHKQYAEKVITFEFSHFLSPQSIYPSAQNLNKLYVDYYLND